MTHMRMQVSRFQKALGKGLQNQNRAVANLFKNPNKIEEVASTLQVRNLCVCVCVCVCVCARACV
jgi:hypothetical protein